MEPTLRQRQGLEGLLRVQCELYNAALEERRGRWRWSRESVSYMDQTLTLTGLREARPDVFVYGVTVCRGTLRRLDRGFQAVYRRCRAGRTPGFPRFKPVSRWSSAQWEDTQGWKLKEAERRVYLQGIGDLKVRLHRPTRGIPKAITVKREGRRWYVTIRCVNVPAEPLPATGREIGIDLGVTSLVTTSDGDKVANQRFARRSANRLAVAQRTLESKRRGSNRRRKAAGPVAAAHRKVRNQRIDHLHKVSRALVDHFDLICHEDLNVAGMTRRPAPRPDSDGGFAPNGAIAKTGLNRSINDAGWATLVAMLTYKAEDAGRDLVAVRAAYTSQRCSRCGHTAAENRVTRATFRCLACGFELHADTNAARNVLTAGRAVRPQAA